MEIRIKDPKKCYKSKNTSTEMKKAFDRLISILYTAEKKNFWMWGYHTETSKTGMWRLKKL